MLFMVKMNVVVPHGVDPTSFQQEVAAEKERAQELQRSGVWRHLWRVAGKYANVSIFDVADAEELHTIMSSLPLFKYMDVSVTALCRHPSSIHTDDR